MLRIEDVKLAVVGLGYVGLPLAVEFGKKRSVIGFDINTRRIDALKAGHDHTLEVSDAELAEAKQLSYTADRAELGQANVFIVTVPTPIDEYKQPDLTPLVKASETIGSVPVSYTHLEPAQLDGEGPDQQVAGDEHRHRKAQHREAHHRPIQQPALAPGRQHAQRNRHDQREDQRQHRQAQRRFEPRCV